LLVVATASPVAESGWSELPAFAWVMLVGVFGVALPALVYAEYRSRNGEGETQERLESRGLTGGGAGAGAACEGRAGMTAAWWVRLVWGLTGVTWALVSLLILKDPEYREPSSALDWAFVLSYSTAWCLMGLSVVMLGQVAGSRYVMAFAWIAAIGGFVTGVANFIEDGIGVSEFSAVYLAGFFTGLLALVPLAVSLWRAANLVRLAWLAVGLLAGIALFPLGGGFIVLAAFGSIAIAPDAYTVKQHGATAGASTI
jgi:hypothetical protein